ncbi:MAG: hypothetical protein ACR2HR_03610 [Euzebya sp.]
MASVGRPDRPPPWPASHRRVHRRAEVLSLLGSLPSPVRLVIDDLQWLDVGSARALLFLLRRLVAEPLLVVLAGRPDAPATLGGRLLSCMWPQPLTRGQDDPRIMTDEGPAVP